MLGCMRTPTSHDGWRRRPSERARLLKSATRFTSRCQDPCFARMRARSPAGSIVLNEFQWIHHTNLIASMISWSEGMCERGDGMASGGNARQSVRTTDRGGGRKTACDMVR